MNTNSQRSDLSWPGRTHLMWMLRWKPPPNPRPRLKVERHFSGHQRLHTRTALFRNGGPSDTPSPTMSLSPPHPSFVPPAKVGLVLQSTVPQPLAWTLLG